MSPINPIVLQRRHAELGRIRLGHKASTERGGTRPAKLETFRFTSPNAGLIAAIAELYGGEARPWDNGGRAEWEVYTSAKSVPVIVVKGGFSQWMETWTGGGCVHRCDGVTDVLTGEPCDDRDPAHNDARPTTRLSVMLRDVESLGVWRLETHGWNAAAELPSMAEIAMLVGDLVPANLHLVERSSKVEVRGKVTTSRYVVPVLDLAVSKQRLVQIVAAQTGAATAELGAAGAPPGAAQIAAGPMPDYAKGVREAASKDDLNAIWRAAGEAGHLGDELKQAIIARAAEIDSQQVEQVEQAAAPADGIVGAEEVLDEGDPTAAWMAVVTLAGQHGWTTDQLVAAFEQELALPPADASLDQIAAFEADLRAGRIERAA